MIYTHGSKVNRVGKTIFRNYNSTNLKRRIWFFITTFGGQNECHTHKAVNFQNKRYFDF